MLCPAHKQKHFMRSSPPVLATWLGGHMEVASHRSTLPMLQA